MRLPRRSGEKRLLPRLGAAGAGLTERRAPPRHGSAASTSARRHRRSAVAGARWPRVHGDRRPHRASPSGDASPSPRRPSRVDRWSGAHRRPQPSPATGVSWPPPTGYDQFLLCLAVARAGRPPVPGERPDAARRGRPRGRRLRRRRWCIRAADELDGAEPRSAPCRPNPTTSPRSSTRRARPASRRAPSSPTGRSWAARRGGARPATCRPPRRGRPRACRWPTSWGSPSTSACACGRHPRVLLRALPARRGARRHRAASGLGLRRACRPCTGCCSRPAPTDRDLDVGAAVDLGRRRHATGPGRALQAVRRDGDACRSSARSARRRSSRATAWSRSAGASPPKVSPPVLAVGARRLARRPAARLPVPGGRRRRRPGSAGPGRRAVGQGPGGAHGLLGRPEATRRPRSPTTAGCAPATWLAAGRSAPSCSPAAART